MKGLASVTSGPLGTELARERLKKDPTVFRTVVERMQMAGAAGPAQGLFEKSADLYPWPAEPVDFTPAKDWLIAELQNLVGLMLIPPDSSDVRKLAEAMVFVPAAPDIQ